MSKKSRLDNELVNRGEFASIDDAVPFIMAGEVLVNGNIVYKKDHKVSIDDEITIKKNFEYVSRGAYKLKKRWMISTFQLKVKMLLMSGSQMEGLLI